MIAIVMNYSTREIELEKIKDGAIQEYINSRQSETVDIMFVEGDQVKIKKESPVKIKVELI